MIWTAIAVALLGCVRDPGPEPNVLPTEPPTDAIVAHPKQPTPTDPFLQPATEPEPAGFTGAVVITAANCLPCRYLEHDLIWLTETRPEWSLSDDPDSDADWILRPPDDDDQTPTIIYFRGGKEIDRSTGYTVAAAFGERRPALLAIVKAHPNSTAAHR